MSRTFYGCASITSSQRHDIVRKDVIPGPGTYDPTLKDSKQIPLWELKPKIQYTSCFYNKNPGIPAPGTYNICAEIKQQSKSKNKNSKIIRYKQRNYVERNSPIIALNLPSFVDRKTGYSFGYRDQIKVLQRSPGPIYHPDQKNQQQRKNKIFNSSMGLGYGERHKVQKQQSPGPGIYQPQPSKQYATSGKWTFSKSERKNKSIFKNPIGPGQYNPKLYTTSQSFIFKGRYSQNKQANNNDTSPFSYNLPDSKSKRSAIINNSSVKIGQKQQQIQYPCPFSYSPSTYTPKPGCGYSLGKRLSQIDHNIENPGPGSYEINNDNGLFAKTGGFICRKQGQKKKLMDESDNFYKYSPNIDKIAFKYPQFTFKQWSSATTIKQKQNKIGPGSYNILKPSNSQSYSMSKNARFKPLLKQKSYQNFQLNQPNYSSIGNLPSYILKRKKQINKTQRKQKQKQQIKQNIEDKQN